MASITKTVGTSHSGWTGGDGRTYNNNSCRYLTPTVWDWYYVYTYGFSFLGTDTIDGVRVRVHTGGYSASPEEASITVQLVNGFTHRGTGKSSGADTDISSCTAALLYTFGGATDKWGLSQAQINTYVRDSSSFGVALRQSTIAGLEDNWECDGFEIVVYYTPAGYPHDVNDVPAANIASVSEVLANNINTINER